MKTKQLANVLIRILGLSEVVHSLPAIISGLYSVMRADGYGHSAEVWLYPVSSLVLAGLGVCLILKSRELAAWLFKDEAE